MSFAEKKNENELNVHVLLFNQKDNESIMMSNFVPKAP